MDEGVACSDHDVQVNMTEGAHGHSRYPASTPLDLLSDRGIAKK